MTVPPSPFPRWLRAVWPYGLAALSGLLLVGSMPGTAVPPAWVILLVPLLGGLDALAARPVPRGRPWLRRGLRAYLACALMGFVWAVGTGDWLVNTMHVFGHLPLALALGINAVGHGLLVGTEFWLTVAVPLLLTRHRPALALFVVPLWATGVQVLLPRLFFWSWGQFMYPLPALVQPADLLGSGGLNLIHLPLQLVLYAAVRQALHLPVVPRRQLTAAGLGVIALLGVAVGYGIWRTNDLAAVQDAAPTARVVAVQPNFSLRHLASNPALSPSDRQQSLSTLFADSDRALATMPPVPAGSPTIVVWPESVFPAAYRHHEQARTAVQNWVRSRGVHLVLATVDAERGPEGRQVYGASVHVPPEGEPAQVYHKIVLMPWGEWIPGGETFPLYRRLIKAWIPQIGEFSPGDAYTVFDLGQGVRLAPMICYDATQTDVARGMTANGANLGLVLANLGWFGPTTASLQFEHVIRFRSIENRLPLFFISQNGRTVFFDALGRPTGRMLPSFTADTLTLDAPLVGTGSLYSHYGVWIDRLWMLLGALALAFAGWDRWRAGRRQQS